MDNCDGAILTALSFRPQGVTMSDPRCISRLIAFVDYTQRCVPRREELESGLAGLVARGVAELIGEDVRISASGAELVDDATRRDEGILVTVDRVGAMLRPIEVLAERTIRIDADVYEQARTQHANALDSAWDVGTR